MTEALLPINPEHVNNIFQGKKKFEFRKVKYSRKIDRIYIYSTYPVMRIVGYVEVLNTLIDKPEKIWKISNQKPWVIKKYLWITI